MKHPSRLTGSFIAMAAIAAALAAPSRAAPAAAREGSQLITDFRATINAKSRSDIKQTTVMHELKGSCRLAAGPLQPFGVMGPTKEQEKAMQGAQPDKGMKDLERAVAACKGDQQCLQRVAAAAAENPPAGAAPAGGTIQPWFPQSCSGAFKVADETFINDPGGEGGGGAYQEVRRVTGDNVIPDGGEDGWHGAFLDHDVAKGVSTYYFTAPEPMLFLMTSDRSGYQPGKKSSKVAIAFTDTSIPAPFATLQGPPAAGKSMTPVPGGTLTIEWQVRR